MLIPRLRNALFMNNTSSVIPSNSLATQFFASFHKANNKFSFNVKGRQDKTLSKNQIRVAIRQRRADTKRALDDFLHKSGCSSRHSYLEGEARLNWKVGLEDNSDNFHEKRRSKCSARHAKKSHQKKNKSKSRRYSFYESFDDHPESTLNSRHESLFRKAESEWRENLNSKSKHRSRSWGSSSDSESESDDESCAVGPCANRALLGLPLSGPLKLEDVKKAFHVSALKWHPDKHQGPSSQALAEEKFKACVEAYKSLCKLTTKTKW